MQPAGHPASAGASMRVIVIMSSINSFCLIMYGPLYSRHALKPDSNASTFMQAPCCNVAGAGCRRLRRHSIVHSAAAYAWYSELSYLSYLSTAADCNTGRSMMPAMLTARMHHWKISALPRAPCAVRRLHVLVLAQSEETLVIKL